MINQKPTVLKVEHDFEALCSALDGLSDKNQSIFLAKLALILCDLIGDANLVDEAMARSRLNLERT